MLLKGARITESLGTICAFVGTFTRVHIDNVLLETFLVAKWFETEATVVSMLIISMKLNMLLQSICISEYLGTNISAEREVVSCMLGFMGDKISHCFTSHCALLTSECNCSCCAFIVAKVLSIGLR